MALRGVFITNLKRLRKQAGLSQMALAEKIDTAPSYIGEIEIGRKFPSIEMVEKIAGALKIKAHLLFEDRSGTEEGRKKTTDYFSKLGKAEREGYAYLTALMLAKNVFQNFLGEVPPELDELINNIQEYAKNIQFPEGDPPAGMTISLNGQMSLIPDGSRKNAKKS